MSVLGRVLVSSAERLDLPDFLSLDSYSQGDFKYLMSSLVGGVKPYILKGFDVISPANAIGTQNISITIANSIVYYPGSNAGPFFHGLPEGDVLSVPLVPNLRQNATNYVYLALTTTEAAKDTRAFWDPNREGGVGGEFTQDVNTQSVLIPTINVSTSSFPDGTMPICKVVVGASFITSIEDARDMMFRLGQGGINPNPLAKYTFRSSPTSAYERNEPNTLMTSALDPNSFQGGDKNIQSMKEWMDVVMTKLLELSGTTYWYQNTSTLSLVNIFKDALSSSIKSKGIWQSSATPGLLTWTEDVILQSISDNKDVIVRAGNKTLANNQVMYLAREQNVPINTGSLAVSWFNGINYVNGALGSFESLTKGDWIKKADDVDYLFLRVEEFYAGTNLSGGVTAPGSALSIKLSATYAGVSESKQGVYVKGSYLTSEVLVANRSDAALTTIGGDMFWLAMRSDTILSLNNAVTTTLAIDITNHDGIRAKVTSVAHGLTDKQRIGISGTTNYNGIFPVMVETADIFYISLTGGPFADELAQSAFYTTVTTIASSTVDGFQLESANHSLEIDESVTLSSTTNYNGTFQVFPKTATNFTIPVTTAIATEITGVVTAVHILVRTSVGPTNLSQGENQHIGEGATENILSFIGSDNDIQTYPIYNNPLSYNTLWGTENYNSDLTDNLSVRASRLTSMMADKAQDKTIQWNYQNCSLVANNAGGGSTRSLAFTSLTGSSPVIDVILPGSSIGGTIDISSPIVLDSNQSAYVTINRNATFAALVPVVANTSSIVVSENIFIIASRKADTSVYLADGTEVIALAMIALLGHKHRVENQNLNASVIEGGIWSAVTNATAIDVTLSTDAYVNLEGIAKERNTILAQTISFPTVGTVAYISVSRDSGIAVNKVVTVADIASISNISSPDIVIIAKRMSDGIILPDESKIKVGESKALGEILTGFITVLTATIFEEPLSIIAGAPANSREMTGPVAPAATITIPLDSKNADALKQYVVGKGTLQVYLNGIYLHSGLDYTEIGATGTSSNTFTTNIDLVVFDTLTIRINNV